MTKYLITALVILILITGVILIMNSTSTPPSSSPSPRSTSRPPAPNLITSPSLSPATPLPSEDLAQYQSDTDKLYADQVKQQDEEYPWLQQLPLQTNSYFVYFETSNNTFTAEIYNQAQSEQIKQDILNQLGTLNIDTAKYNINWQIKQR